MSYHPLSQKYLDGVPVDLITFEYALDLQKNGYRIKSTVLDYWIYAYLGFKGFHIESLIISRVEVVKGCYKTMVVYAIKEIASDGIPF